MFTQHEKQMLQSCIEQSIRAARMGASKTKRPEFKVLYEKDERQLMELKEKVHGLKAG